MKTILLTGASGIMGRNTIGLLLNEGYNVRTFSLDTPTDRKVLSKYKKKKNLTTIWGDLRDYEKVLNAVKNVDIVLHLAALVSPQADKNPELAMEINIGSTKKLIQAIKDLKQQNHTKFVFIGTMAETGDRLPPIHWGRVGDPIKPGFYDYYALSKTLAERCVIDSGLKYWVSLRQTGMASGHMLSIRDSIIFHQPLNNLIEYISDRDSGILLHNICKKLPADFWCHIYNIGGGEKFRLSCFDLLKMAFRTFGIQNMSKIFNSSWFATRNFHGQYFLDSNKLESYLHFQHDGKEYIENCQRTNLGPLCAILKSISKIPIFENIVEKIIKKEMEKNLYGERGTMQILNSKNNEKIAALFRSKKDWETLKPIDFNYDLNILDINKVVYISHGYDENKPKTELNIEDIKQAAVFRGGKCLSSVMQKGDWKTKLNFECAFGHKFSASPTLVLEGGHWCEECEKESWNYHEIAKVNPFFAQVWYPLHDKNEIPIKIPKLIAKAF